MPTMPRDLARLHFTPFALVALFSILGFASCGCGTIGKATEPCGSAATGSSPRELPASAPGSASEPRNVILMLSDGTAPEAWTLARWIKGDPLEVDAILTGAIRTYGADSLITDSAPGASAYATGHKGSDKAIAVGAWNETIDGTKTDPGLAFVPLVTLLEAAKLQGFATGLIATSNIQHATPAAFSAHVPDRNQYEEIAEQQVYQGMDLVLSGGAQHLLPKTFPGGTRSDGEDLVAVLRDRGYRYVTTRDELFARSEGRIWGAFAPNDLAYEIDRPRFAPSQPSLAEMTAYALANLSASTRGRAQGFFLFVEGSKVDWAAHANDPAGVVSDLLAFDAAVGNALRFAKRHTNTQVIVVADHATGGLSIGAASDPNYSRTDDSVLLPLRRAKVTAERMAMLLEAATSKPQLLELIGREWGMVDVAEQESDALFEAVERKTGVATLLARMLSVRARIGWTTNGHTGADVYLFAYGPERPFGLVENTAIGRGIASFLGFDLAPMQQRLYVDPETVLPQLGYSLRFDRSDPRNVVVVVEKNHKQARMPLAKNQLIAEGKAYELEGIVVFAASSGRVFVPRQAIEVIRSELP